MKAKRPRKRRELTEEEKDACGRAALVAMREVLRSGKWEMEMDHAARVYLYAVAMSAGEEAADSAMPKGVDRYLGLNGLHVLASAIYSIGWNDEDLDECSHYAVGAMPWVDLCSLATLSRYVGDLDGALDVVADGDHFVRVSGEKTLGLLRDHFASYGDSWREEQKRELDRMSELLNKKKPTK